MLGTMLDFRVCVSSRCTVTVRVETGPPGHAVRDRRMALTGAAWCDWHPTVPFPRTSARLAHQLLADLVALGVGLVLDNVTAKAAPR